MFLLEAFIPAAVVVNYSSYFILEKTDGVGAVSGLELVVTSWRHGQHLPRFRIFFGCVTRLGSGRVNQRMNVQRRYPIADDRLKGVTRRR